jgi:2-polyprenyl-3-methyl-5-hydroxy-6-metoxy-1,4-benzoquinol methylase
MDPGSFSGADALSATTTNPSAAVTAGGDPPEPLVECRGWMGRLEPGVNPFGASGRERLVLTDDMGIGYWHDPVSDIFYASPRFSRESLRDQYQRAAAHIDTRIYVDFDRRAWRERGDRSYHVSRLKLDLVERWLGPTVEPRRILDVGCHVGLFVLLAQEAGFDCRGIDVSADAIRAGTEHLGLRGLRAATLEEAGFADGSFDGLVVWDVLEHVPDLANLVAHCARVLRPGGFFFAQVPNHRGVSARLKTLASRAGLRGRRYHHFGFPWHLYHFSPRSLALLVRRAGMEPVEIASFSHRTKDGRPPRGALRLLNRGIERLSLSDYLYVVARRPGER